MNAKLNNDDRKEIARLYVSGLTADEIWPRFGITKTTVFDALRRLGVPSRCPARSLPYDDSAFDDAATDEHAGYWVGMIGSDGCISQPSGRRSAYMPEVVLSISQRDIEHVRAFKRFMQAGHKVSIVNAPPVGFSSFPTRMARLTIASSKLVAKLAEYGITPRKSKTFAPKIVFDNPAFWRGMVDGDGSLYLATLTARRGQRVYKYQYPHVQLCGSLGAVDAFRVFLLRRNLIGNPNTHFNKGAYSLHLANRQAVNTIRLLYENCTVALPRKKRVADEILARWG